MRLNGGRGKKVLEAGLMRAGRVGKRAYIKKLPLLFNKGKGIQGLGFINL